MNYLDRRSFLKTSAAGSAAWFHINCGVASRRPDIVLVIADDHAWCDSGAYGNREVNTPNIDRLASQGVRFTRAFTGTAMCAPMRQQMYTGIFPVRNGAYPNHSQIKPGIKTLPSYLQELGYRVGLAGKTHFGPLEQYPFEWIGEKNKLTFDAMAEFVNRDRAQPYCMLVTSHEPHQPWDQGDPSKYDAEKLTIPDYFVDTPEMRQALTRYYAEIESFDGELGRVMDIVNAGGREENTILTYCSEQGIQCPGGKWTCYDLGLRQGFIMRWPERIPAGSVLDAMVQGVDYMPTMIEAAGGAAPEGLDGRSYLGVLGRKTEKHAREVFGVHTTRGIIDGSDCYPVRSIRTETDKLILNLNHKTEFRNTLIVNDNENYWRSWAEKAKTDERAAFLVERYLRRPAVEYYDIVKDPFELDNLATEPVNRTRIEDLTKRLYAWMAQQGDLGVETEMRVTAHRRS